MPVAHPRTSSCIQAATAPIALEVLGLLVRDEDFEVVEVTLAVEAPRALELLLEIGVPLALLGHLDDVTGLRGSRRCWSRAEPSVWWFRVVVWLAE
jgi:hypothetical protein